MKRFVLLSIIAIAATAAGCQFDRSSRSQALDETHPDASPPPVDAGKEQDCDAAPPPVCGDGVCDDGEDCDVDCCDHQCGDGVCSADEDCPADCDHGHCGDHVCDEGEQCDADCLPPDTCGDDVCQDGEICAEDCDEPAAGCTRTQGYWKTHHEAAKNDSQRIDWPAPHDEDDLLCGRRLVAILRTPPRGDAWIILAHQYIAASLNVASGASSPSSVDGALADASAFLLSNCGGVAASEAPEAIALSELLDSYNHGSIGPGHCD